MNNEQKIAPSIIYSESAIEFNDILDLNVIQEFQDLFSAATGVLSLITHPDGTPITQPSNAGRLHSDPLREVRTCMERNTLYVTAPINVGEKHIANWLICQGSFNDLDDHPIISADQFTTVSSLLFACARELSEKAFSKFQIKLQLEERNRVKEKMLEIEWFNRRIVETTNEGIWAMDSNYHTTYINNKMAEMLGYTIEEVMAMPVTDFIFSEDRQDHLQKRVQRMSGTSGFYERRFKRKDGSEIWTIVSSTAIIDTDGTFMGSFGMIMDMSTRKHAEISLAQSEEKFRLIAENTSDGILLIGSSQNILFASPAADKMMGVPPGETMKIDSSVIFNLIHPEDRDATFSKIFQALSNRVEDLIYVYRVMHQNGKYIWREDHAKFTYDQAGNHLNTIVIAQDITERKLAEEEITALNKELDLRVKQRTAELETANKELETFSYSISHDLKAPLRHIGVFVDLFLENKSTTLTEIDLKYLNKITESANEMTRLIDAILSFSRLNLTELRKTRIHTSGMVRQVINFFEPEIRNRKIAFNVQELPDIYGDEELIRQVWTNLISNAVKYTGKKVEAIIDIGVIPTENNVTFFVKDNGAGFTMKQSDKLFGLFQRLHNSFDFEGVGIGLANVNRIVKRHGGECRGEGTPDVGATFYFTLPS